MNLIKLNKQVLLDTHKGFVDSWNFIVDFVNNLAGDGDLDASKSITVDRKVENRPVIRMSGSSSGGSSKPGLFEIVSGEFTNCYYSIGGKTYLCTSPGSVPTDGIAALVIDISGSSPSASVSTYATFAALQTAQADTSKYIIPLYTLEDSEVTIDWRIGPSAAMGEF